MGIDVEMNRNRVSLYIVQFNLKNISVTACTIEILRMNVSSYNYCFDIWNVDKK